MPKKPTVPPQLVLSVAKLISIISLVTMNQLSAIGQMAESQAMIEPQQLLSSVCPTLISSNSQICGTYEHVIATPPPTKLRSLWSNQTVGLDEELVMQATIATETLMSFSSSKFQTQSHLHRSGRATHYCCPWQERLKGLCILASFAFFRNLLDLASPFLPFPCHHLIPCKWYFLSPHLIFFLRPLYSRDIVQ